MSSAAADGDRTMDDTRDLEESGGVRLKERDPHSNYRVLWLVRSLAVLNFLGAASYGVMAPVLPILMTEYFARAESDDATIDCDATPQAELCVDGSKRAAWLSSIFAAVGSVLLILLSPAIGHASDMFGRKVFLLVSQVLNVGVSLTTIYFIQPYGSIMPYYALTLVNSAFGVDGVAGAAAADMVPPPKRAAAFGFIFAATVLGYCAGSGIAPLLSGPNLLFVALGIAIVRVAWVAFAFDETLPPEARACKKVCVIGNPLCSMMVLFRSRLFVYLTTLIALSSFATTGILQIQFYFFNAVMDFDSKDLAYLSLVGAAATIVGQGLVLQPLVNRVHERGVIIVSFVDNLLAALVTVIIAGFYPQKWLAFAMVCLGVLASLSFPAISALTSMSISEKEQGRVQGAIYGVRALFDALGSLIYGRLYGTMKTGSSLSRMTPYLLSVGVYIVGTVVAVFFLKQRSVTRLSDTVEIEDSDVYAILGTILSRRSTSSDNHSASLSII